MPSPDSPRVLVVLNSRSRTGIEVADYYARRRGIPQANVVSITCSDQEEVSEAEFHASIERPLKERLQSMHGIDFIVLIKGVPIRMDCPQHYSVDAWIAAANLPLKAITHLNDHALSESRNPYFGSSLPFSHRQFGFYLVTRLDGYSVDDCKALVDRSIDAGPETGPFLFSEAANRRDEVYGPTQEGLNRAACALEAKAFEVNLHTSGGFPARSRPLAGYVGWGSNDADFDLAAYRKLRFKPGALCETFVSTSARTFRPMRGGQSLIADLIAGGATGVKGYVSEPYAFALAKPEILFDRYTSGRNLAESFYAASEYLKWKDVVVGDPLCSPYSKTKRNRVPPIK